LWSIGTAEVVQLPFIELSCDLVGKSLQAVCCEREVLQESTLPAQENDRSGNPGSMTVAAG